MELTKRFQAITHGRSLIRTPDDVKAAIWADIKETYPDVLHVVIRGVALKLEAQKSSGKIISYRSALNPTEYAVISTDCSDTVDNAHLIVSYGVVFVSRSRGREIIIPNKIVNLT